jgi:hypothetical protein
MSLTAKVLLWWGGSILGLTYLLGSVAWAVDAYVKHGVGPMVAVLVFASSIPALVLGMVLQELRDARRWRQN